MRHDPAAKTEDNPRPQTGAAVRSSVRGRTFAGSLVLRDGHSIVRVEVVRPGALHLSFGNPATGRLAASLLRELGTLTKGWRDLTLFIDQRRADECNAARALLRWLATTPGLTHRKAVFHGPRPGEVPSAVFVEAFHTKEAFEDAIQDAVLR